jgi:hypothetical protein
MKKTNLDCQIYKIEGGLEMGENSFAFNSLAIRNFNFFFTNELTFQLCNRPQKYVFFLFTL